MVKRIREEDHGFSLIELMIAMALATILAGLTMTSYRNYNRGQDLRGATREVVAILRSTQIRAVTEATTYKARFTSSSLDVYRVVDPADATKDVKARPTYTLTEKRFAENLEFLVTSPYGFTQSDGSVTTYALFYARGSSTPGTMRVRRLDNGNFFDVSVEGLTSRVSYTGA